MEHPDLDRRAAACHAGPLAVHVAADDRLVDDVAAILAGEPPDRCQRDVGNGLDDPGVDPRDLLLAAEGGVGMGDVVPDDVIGVGVQSRLDVVGVLGCEVPFDDVHGHPFRSSSALP